LLSTVKDSRVLLMSAGRAGATRDPICIGDLLALIGWAIYLSGKSNVSE